MERILTVMCFASFLPINGAISTRAVPGEDNSYFEHAEPILKCESERGGLHAWYHNGNKINIDNDKYTAYGKTLKILSLEEEDSGEYRCTVGSEKLDTRQHQSYLLKVESTAKEITITAEAPNVFVNTNIKLTCEIGKQGTPPANRFRFYDGKNEIGDSASAIFQHRAPDTIGQAQYTCEAGNSVGWSYRSPAINIYISAPIEILLPTEETELQLNVTEKFPVINCIIIGSSVEGIHWIKDNREFNGHDKLSTFTEKTLDGTYPHGQTNAKFSEIIFASKVVINDTDGRCKEMEEIAGKYQCMTNGPSGGQPEVKSAVYDIRTDPACFHLGYSPGPDPPQNAGPNIGLIVGVACGILVILVIVLIIVFFVVKRRRNKDDSETKHNETSNPLLPKGSEEPVYQELDETKVAPHPPKDLKVESRERESCTLSWDAPVSGASVKGYRIRIKRIGRDGEESHVKDIEPENNELKITVDDLDSATHFFYVSSYNDYGYSTEVHVQSAHVYEQRPPKPGRSSLDRKDIRSPGIKDLVKKFDTLDQDEIQGYKTVDKKTVKEKEKAKDKSHTIDKKTSEDLPPEVPSKPDDLRPKEIVQMALGKVPDKKDVGNTKANGHALINEEDSMKALKPETSQPDDLEQKPGIKDTGYAKGTQDSSKEKDENKIEESKVDRDNQGEKNDEPKHQESNQESLKETLKNQEPLSEPFQPEIVQETSKEKEEIKNEISKPKTLPKPPPKPRVHNPDKIGDASLNKRPETTDVSTKS